MSEEIQSSVTVLIPVYNGAEHIGECLESVLHQSYEQYKVVVVNDGSTDNTLEVLRNYPEVEVLSYEENRGISYALNYGIDHIDTDYIVRMDADDLAHYDRIRVQVEFMEKNPEIFMSACTTFLGSPTNNNWDISYSNKVTTPKELRLFYLFHPYLLHPSLIYRTKKFKQKGYRYDSHFDGVEDFELHRRIIMEEDVCQLHLPLIHLRSRKGSASNVGKKETLNRLFRVNTHFYGSLGIQSEKIALMGKGLFPRLYGTTREELEEIEHFTNELLCYHYFKQRIEKGMVDGLFDYLYKEVQL